MEESKNNKVISFINSKFGSDIESLSNAGELYKNLLEEKSKIEEQLTYASTEVPRKLDTAVNEAETCTAKIKGFSAECAELTGEIDNHGVDVCGVNKKLSQLMSQIDELKKYTSYLQCLARIEDLSSDIQTAILIGSRERAVQHFTTMATLVQTLQSSKCEHLLKFANDTLLYWYKNMRDNLASEFEEVLIAWRWPFIVSSVQPKPLPNVTELRNKLPVLFTNLLKLQLPSSLDGSSQKPHPLLTQVPGWRPIALPINCMLKPLKKRFKYHFYGNKQTNSLDKPEWYLSQVLTWIRDHKDFLRREIQPLLDKASLHYLDAVAEFSRGLVLLVMEKLNSDLHELLYDDHVFCHMIDEVLAFHKELSTMHHYPATQASCLTVLTQDTAFHKWLQIEKKFSLEKMDKMLSSSTAWESPYKDMGDLDEQKIPECVEVFMTLMLTMTDRYKALPSLPHRVEFVELQLDLLEDFRLRIVQIKTAQTETPLDKYYIAILNAADYICKVLKDWTELAFFMELHLYKVKYEQKAAEADRDQVTQGYPGVIEAEESEETPPVKTARLDSTQSNIQVVLLGEQDLEGLEGTLFDQMIELYSHLRNEMLANIITYITDDVKARSKPYRKDKWLALPSQKELLSLALSTSACEMLMVLKDLLHQVNLSLNHTLSTQCWQRVAANLNTFIYTQVILGNHFNDGGAAQLQFDMVRNLFPLFGQYTKKPENYFKDVKEACLLLCLKPGSALLLKEVLYQALHQPHVDHKAKLTDPIAALHDLGIFKFAPEEAELILSLRANLTV